jgi:hypothetical protein
MVFALGDGGARSKIKAEQLGKKPIDYVALKRFSKSMRAAFPMSEPWMS